MGRRGPLATYATRAEKNAARRRRYQQRKQGGQLLSQELADQGDSPTRERCVCEPRPFTESCIASEPGQVAQGPQELALSVGPPTPQEHSLNVESAPDIEPVPEPQSTLASPAPPIPLNDAGFLPDSPGVSDSDSGNPLTQEEPSFGHDATAEEILAVPDEPAIETAYSANEHELDAFGFPDLAADSDTDASTDSAYGSGESDDDYSRSDRSSTETETTDGLAVRLARQLLQFQGCCPECHQQALELPADQDGSPVPTIRLADLQKWPCPKVLDHPQLPTPETIWTKLWSAPDRRRLFCGIGNDHTMPPVVHIPGEEEQLTPPDVIFDTDSVTAFLGSLAAARQGIRWQPTQRPVSDLRSSLHLDPLPVEYTDHQSGHTRKTSLPVHKIKHFTLGRVVGMEEASIYVLLPSLSHPRSPTARLSDGDFGLWTDQVFLPALHACYPRHYLQHYPSSFAHASMNAWASSKEGHSIRTPARQQQLSCFIPPEGLVALWTTILEIIEQKNLRQFRVIHLLLDAKNLKVATKGKTWLDMQGRFNRTWSSAVNQEHITTMYRDIGKEICPRESDPTVNDPDFCSRPSPEPETFLWRRCCLEKYREDYQPASSSSSTFFPFSFLRDSGSLNMETRRHSPHRQCGLLYTQFYNSVKEVLSAGRQYPFSNRMIESIALDPTVQRNWEYRARTTTHNSEVLINAYNATKMRSAKALQTSGSKSFGVREEYRVRTDLLHQIDLEIHRLGFATHVLRLHGSPLPHTQPFLIYRTSTVLGWLWWNMNKFCAGFEMAYSLSQRGLVLWEHTRVMILFLRCLRLSFGGGGNQLSRSFACWQDVRDQPPMDDAPPADSAERRWEGIGMKVTIERTGYAWFLDKIDWETMFFHIAHRPYMQIHTPSVLGRYTERYQAVRGAKKQFLELEGYLQTLDTAHYSADPARIHALLSLLVDFCLQAFRKDVFETIQTTLIPTSREAALAGLVSLCGPALEDHIDPAYLPLRLAHSRLPRIPCGVSDIVQWFWVPYLDSEVDQANVSEYDINPEQIEHHDTYVKSQRTAFQTVGKKTYWTLFNRCLKRIGHVFGKRQQQAWCENLQRRFIATHWVVPYPTPGKFISTMAPGKYRWWAGHHPAVAHAFPCTDNTLPPLVTAEMVSELPVDGWTSSKTIMCIRIQLPSVPYDLPTFLRNLPVCTIPVFPLAEGEIIFPVDVVRPRFPLPNSDGLFWQPRQLRSRPLKPWEWKSGQVSQNPDALANQLSGLAQWLSQFRLIFHAGQANLLQVDGPSTAVVILPPLPRIARHALPAADDHHSTNRSSLCLHLVPFDPPYGPKIRARFLSPVVGPLVPQPRDYLTSFDLPLPPTACFERVFRLQSTAQPLQPTIPTTAVLEPSSFVGSLVRSPVSRSLRATDNQADHNSTQTLVGPLPPSYHGHIITVSYPEARESLNRGIRHASAGCSPPRRTPLPHHQVSQSTQTQPQLVPGPSPLACQTSNGPRPGPASCNSCHLPDTAHQGTQNTNRTQTVRRSARESVTLYTWTGSEQLVAGCAPIYRTAKRRGRRIRYHTEEERRAAAGMRAQRYRAKIAGRSFIEPSREFQIIMDPWAELLGEASIRQWYY